MWPRRTCCIVGVDIPLFLNSLDIFARKVVSLVELVKVLRINPGGGTAIYGLYRYVPL